MTNKPLNDSELDALFATERTREFEPSALRMDAIFADAQALQAACSAPKPIAKQRNWVAQAFQMMPQLGMSFACAMFGLYVGYASPAASYLGVGDETSLVEWSSESALNSDVYLGE